jgi:hypothetical protein
MVQNRRSIDICRIVESLQLAVGEKSRFALKIPAPSGTEGQAAK